VSDRPVVAILANVPTPYRVHLHRRIVREMPEIELHSLYTHDTPDQPWELEGQVETNPTCFGPGERVTDRRPLASFSRDWKKGSRIVEWLREHNARFVIVCGYNNATLLRVITATNKHGPPAWLCSDSNIRGERAAGLAKTVKSRLVPAILKRVRGAMPFGTAGRDYFRKYGVPDDRIVPWPCEPDYSIIEQLTEGDLAEVRSKHGLAPDRKRMVFCGRMAEVKRPDLLVDAFLQIADERPDWDLVMIGDGPLKEQIAHHVENDDADRVKLLGFVNDPAEIGAIYRSSDVLVLPSDYEPWGLVVNEAAVAGCALVVSDVVGAAPDLVRDGVNGRVFRAGDGEALKRALLDVTEGGRASELGSQSPVVLSEYRDACDPVKGLREALKRERVI